MNHFELGLLLMVVGMTTVFVILLLVIGLGKGLILLVNKYAPEETPPPGSARNKPAGTGGKDLLPGQTAAAIVAAVSAFTAGNGKVTRIEK